MSYAAPGRSFAYISHMLSLNAAVLAPTPVGIELMLAVFWERGPFFNNAFQLGGATAVGFGRTQTGEFYRFDPNDPGSQKAQAGGYLVYNLPPRTPLAALRPGGSRRATIHAPLNDYTAVRVACALVRDLYERGIRSKQHILRAYDGVGFDEPQAAQLAKPGGREAVIQGWLQCEEALLEARPGMEPQAVLDALKKAKPFQQGSPEEMEEQETRFLKRLFPEYIVVECD